MLKLGSVEGKLALLATILASGMAFLDGTVVTIAIPTIQAQFDANITQIAWVVNGYSLTLASLMLISGALSDRFGRKRIFSIGIGLFTLFSLFLAFSSSMAQLILGRIGQGIAASLMVPGSLGLINTTFAKEERGKAIGYWAGASGAIAAAGPFLGGWLTQTFGWPSIFFLNIPLGIATLVLCAKTLAETRLNAKRSLDLLGTVFLFLSMFGISYGLMNGPTTGWSNPLVYAALSLGGVSSILFLFVETHVAAPLLPLSLFQSPLVTGANLATFFLYFALNGVMFFLVLNFQQIQHYSPAIAGIAMIPAILIITFLSGPAGGLADRIGPRIPMIAGPLVVSIGMMFLTIAGRQANYFFSFLPGLVLLGCGMSLVIAPLTKSALSVPEHYSGAASGVNNTTSRFSALLAVALLSALVTTIFTKTLTTKLSHLSLSSVDKEHILSQAEKLGGIDIVANIAPRDQLFIQEVIDESLLLSFRYALGIGALCALFSAVISFFTIPPIPKNPSER